MTANLKFLSARLRRTFLVLTTAAAVFGAVRPAYGADNPKREARAVWLTPIASDWGLSSGFLTNKAGINSYLDRFAEANINTVYLHVRMYADRMFSISSVTVPGQTYMGNNYKYATSEPVSRYINSSGTIGGTASFDYLQYWIEAAHKRGIEIYAWINPYRIGSSNSYNALSSSLKSYAAYSKSMWFYVPSLKKVKSHLCDIAGLLTAAYDIDGIVFDDYFYPNEKDAAYNTFDDGHYQDYVTNGMNSEYAPSDERKYTKTNGRLSKRDWRCAHVDDMVLGVYRTIKSIKPQVKFCIGPAGIVEFGILPEDGIPSKEGFFTAGDYQYQVIASDVLAWMREGSVDIVSPQWYWTTTHSTAPFSGSRWWHIAANALQRDMYTSVSVNLANSNEFTEANYNEMLTQLNLNRQYAAEYQKIPSGVAFYSAKNFCVGSVMYKRFASGPFSTPALTPMVNYTGNAATARTLTGLALSGSNLTFDAISETIPGSGLKLGWRYTVYAIPESKYLSDVTTASGDIDGSYLLGVTYDNSYTIPAGKRSGYWYAVAPLDRYGNEFAPATVNEPVKPETLREPRLFTPENQEVVNGDVNFVFEKVTNQATRLEISLEAHFLASQIYFSTTGPFTEPTDEKGQVWYQYTVPKAMLPDGVYYWRVVSTYNAGGTAGMVDKYSEERKFIVGEGSENDGYIPKRDNVTYEDKTIGSNVVTMTNLWMRNAAQTPLGWEDNKDGANLRRDMTARADKNGDQGGKDIVYVTYRSTDAAGQLYCFDASTGKLLRTLTLTFDSSYAKGGSTGVAYSLAGVLVDGAGNLIVHNLATSASGKLSVGVVNPADGSVRTVFSANPLARIDHIDVCGDALSNDFYVVAEDLNTTHYLTRWHVVNGKSAEADKVQFSVDANLGMTGRVRFADQNYDYVYVDAAASDPTLYQISAKKSLGTSGTGLSAHNPTGMVAFRHNGKHFLVHPVTKIADGLKWRIFTGDNFITGISGQTACWDIPDITGGIGASSTATGIYDHGAPCCVLQPNTVSRSFDNDSGTRLFVYSPTVGLAAYVLANRLVTGADEIAADTAPDAPAEYYNLQGIRIPADRLQPGIYLRRSGNTITKTIVK